MSGTTKYGDSALFSNTTGANNSAFGNYAAYNNLDASCNTAVGSNALFNNTTGPHNTAIGAGAMCNNVGGQLNTAVGSSALEGLTSAASVGDNNVAIGAQALYNNSDASCNTSIGTFSGYYNTSGNYNTFLGFDADVSNNGTTASGIYSNSTALGYNAIIDASNQIVLGTSNENVKIPGSYVGINGVYNLSGNPHVYNLDVSGNINFSGNLYQKGFIYDASGGSSQWSNGTGSSIYYNTGSVGIGTNSPSSSYVLDVDGSANITLSTANNMNPNLTLSGGVSGQGGAYLQLWGSGTAGENVGINFDTFGRPTPATTIRSVDNGFYSGNLQFLTANSGIDSSSTQAVSMVINPQATGNAFVGIGKTTPAYTLDVSGNMRTTADALINGLTVGQGGGNVASNTAVGYNSLQANTTGTSNTAIGLSSLVINTTGQGNTATGQYSLHENTTGQYNTAIGFTSCEKNTTGSNNTALGYQALFYNEIGGNNTAIGSSSGFDLSGNSACNTFLGANADVSSNTLIYNYSTALGYYARIDASNQIVLGGSAPSVPYPSVKIPGSYVGINGAYNPSSGYNLDISGKTNITLSDASSNNPNLTLRGGSAYTGGAYLQFIGGGGGGENVGINFDTFGRPTPATTIRSVDNGFYSGNLQFLTANSGIDSSSTQAVSMVINPQATGNAFVGIGKTNPAYTLDVSGILQVQDGTFDPMFITTLHGLNVSASNFYYNPKTPTNINSFKIELDGANCLIYKGTPNPFSYQDASATVIQNDGGNGGIALVSTSTYIYVNKNGSTPGVGIMTSNPQYTLDVSGNANITLSNASSNNPNLTLRGGSAYTGGAYLQFIGGGGPNENVGINLDTFSDRAGGPATTIRSVDNGSYSGNLEFLTANSGNINNPQSVSMIIKPQLTGNAFVGIGKIDPSYNLDVSGNMRTTADALINGLTVGKGGGNDSTNTATGYEALLNNTTGGQNTAVGSNSLLNNTDGFDNTAVGYRALKGNTTGAGNIAVGTAALWQITSDNYNTAIGDNALPLHKNGGYNTAVGGFAGYHDISGNFNTFLGCLTDVSNNGSIPYGIYNNSTALGYQATIDASNQIVLGGINSSGAYPSVKIPGSYVGIGGNYNPGNGYALDVNGNVNATSYNTPSDYRIKENVTQLDDTFVVDKLKPVTYLNKKSDKQDIGLIAHELQEIFPELVNGEKDGEEFQSVNYLGLIPILIKEIKLLKERVKILEERN